MFTVALLVGLILALKIYQDKDTVAHDGKISFNVIITVLSLALGLNFLVRIPWSHCSVASNIIRDRRKRLRTWQRF